ncbi:hypothetical protein EVJ32_04885 [Exiguobacterium sp. SH5S4]|uniref:hypothetical protein n=1 Tax=Exiguobacterium sp. SH5S4 TaxID=2510961 RepID=UPI00103B82FF|nr:hypothetical protein [Exiguobacterium sp. SH5S4]TCI26712.1 hypothetical protein EVJ32_04885 [Exiguobacterium sp. SH5S4]
MPKLVVTLKNGKQVESKECPFIQAIMWRTRILKGETIKLPTCDGAIRIDGRSVAFPSVEDYILLETTQAAFCMMLEPYVHYKNEKGQTFQYSEVTGDFEKAERRANTAVYWRVDALPDSTWTRLGKDTIINNLTVV